MRRDALSTSLIFTLLACVATAFETGTSPRFVVETIMPNAQGSKLDTSSVSPVSIALSYFFSTLAMLNVSLVWIEIADNVNNMKKSNSSNVSRYRNLLIAYYVFIFGGIVLSLILENTLVAAAVAMPGVLFVVVTYCVGFFKMRKMLLLLTSSGLQVVRGSASPNNDAIYKIRESLRLIEFASLGVSLNGLLFVVWIGVWVFLGGFIEVPNKGFNIVALSLAWIFVSGTNCTVMWYLFKAISRKSNSIAEKGAIVAMSPLASDGPSTNGVAKQSQRNAKHSQDITSGNSPKI